IEEHVAQKERVEGVTDLPVAVGKHRGQGGSGLGGRALEQLTYVRVQRVEGLGTYVLQEIPVLAQEIGSLETFDQLCSSRLEPFFGRFWPNLGDDCLEALFNSCNRFRARALLLSPISDLNAHLEVVKSRLDVIQSGKHRDFEVGSFGEFPNQLSQVAVEALIKFEIAAVEQQPLGLVRQIADRSRNRRQQAVEMAK